MLRRVEGIPSSETIVCYKVIDDYIKVFYQDGGSNYAPLRSIAKIERIQEYQAHLYVEANMWKLERSTLLEVKSKNQNTKKKKENSGFLTLGLLGGIVCVVATSLDQTSTLSKASIGLTTMISTTGFILNGIRNRKIDAVEEEQSELEYIRKYDMFLRNKGHFYDVLPRYLYRDAALASEEPQKMITINNLDNYSLDDVRNSLSVVARCGATEGEAYQRYLPSPTDRSKY